MITTSIELISPEKAIELLEFSKSQGFENRLVKESAVRRYADDMVNNNWKATGQGISISDDGVLLDGYHRLNAVIKAGVEIPFIVTRGMDKETFRYFDMGVPRGISDIAYIDGFKSHTSKAVACATAIFTAFYDRKDGYLRFPEKTRIYNISREKQFSRIKKLLTEHQEVILKGVQVACKLNKINTSVPISTCYCLFCYINKDKANKFFEKLIEGTNLNFNDPVYLLREKINNFSDTIRNIVYQGNSGRVSRIRGTYWKYIITAWNLFYSSQTRKHLNVNFENPIKIAGLNEYEFAKTFLNPEDLARAFPEKETATTNSLISNR